MKKKGFTLIELLAVIVILAIIALIAVPVIINIISSARNSAFEDTAYGLISAGEMYYAASLLENGMTSDKEFIIEGGKFEGDSLKVKGALPTNGKITVTKDGKVALAITNDEVCITKEYDANEIKIVEEFESCDLPAGTTSAKTLSELAKTNDFATSINTCVTVGTTCAVGTKFAIEVAPGNVQNFYVISDENNKLTLLMESNIGDDVAWITKTDYLSVGGTEEEWNAVLEDYGNINKGPITALNYLESQTSGWTNIANMTYTLTDDAYGMIKRTNVKSRMITETEASALLNKYFLIFGVLGNSYWTSSTDSPDAFYVNFDYVSNNNVTSSFGVCPVIEIQK